MIKEKSIQAFLDELASRASTPGGGSAAAIMGAMGAALLSMVANFTIGKKNYEAVEQEMRLLLAAAEGLRADLTGLIQADVAAFDSVMAAYGMPRETEAEKGARMAAIQAALKVAADVPLKCARQCAEVIRLSPTIAEKGNTSVISDAGVAVLAAEAALRSAALNVYVNINAIKDQEFREDRRRQLESILEGAERRTEEVCKLVNGRL